MCEQLHLVHGESRSQAKHPLLLTNAAVSIIFFAKVFMLWDFRLLVKIRLIEGLAGETWPQMARMETRDGSLTAGTLGGSTLSHCWP